MNYEEIVFKSMGKYKQKNVRMTSFLCQSVANEKNS